MFIFVMALIRLDLLIFFSHLEMLLFTREQHFPLVSNYLIYYFSPMFGFFISLLVRLLVQPAYQTVIHVE